MTARIWVSRPDTQLMAQVMDRSYLQHVVEQLVRRGVQKIHLLLDEPPAEVLVLLGDGSRWGIGIVIHTSRESFLLADGGNESSMSVFGDAVCFPALPTWDAGEGPLWSSLYFHDRHHRSEWTGWALLPTAEFSAFASSVMKGEDWREAAKGSVLRFRKVFIDEPSLGVRTPGQVIESNGRVLRGEVPGLCFHGAEREPGVWIGRGVRVAASAQLVAPCFIGENAWIAADCTIGPDTVVGPECVIEKGTTVGSSVVASGTYLGPGLEVSDSYVRRNVLCNVRLGVEIKIAEKYVVSSMDEFGGLPKWANLSLVVLTVVAISTIWMR